MSRNWCAGNQWREESILCEPLGEIVGGIVVYASTDVTDISASTLYIVEILRLKQLSNPAPDKIRRQHQLASQRSVLQARKR